MSSTTTMLPSPPSKKKSCQSPGSLPPQPQKRSLELSSVTTTHVVKEDSSMSTSSPTTTEVLNLEKQFGDGQQKSEETPASNPCGASIVRSNIFLWDTVTKTSFTLPGHLRYTQPNAEDFLVNMTILGPTRTTGTRPKLCQLANVAVHAQIADQVLAVVTDKIVLASPCVQSSLPTLKRRASNSWNGCWNLLNKSK